MRFLNCHRIALLAVVLVLQASTTQVEAQEDDFWINPGGGLYINFFNWGDETSPGSLDTASFNLPNLYDVDWNSQYSPVAALNVTAGNVLFRSLGSETGGTIWEYEVLGAVNVSDSTFFVGFGGQSHRLSVGTDLTVDDDARMEVLVNSTMTVGGNSTIGGSSNFSVGGSIMEAAGSVIFGAGSGGGAVDDSVVQIEDGATLNVGGFIDVGSVAGSMAMMDVYAGSSVSDTTGTYIGAFSSADGELVVRDAGTTWDSNSTIRVGWQGDGVLTIEDGGVMSGEDVIIGDLVGSSGSVDVTGAFSTLSASMSIQVGPSGVGQVNLRDSGTLNSDGQIVVGPQGVIDVDQPGLGAMISAAGGLVNNGLMELKIGAPEIVADVINNATIRSTSGSITRIHGTLQHDGDEIFTTSSAAIRVFEAASGIGPYTGPGEIQFQADIEPGANDGVNDIGSISFEGDVRQVASTITQIEIAGTGADQFDRLSIDGDVTIAGVLNVYDLGHTFGAEDEFVFIETGGVRTGEFSGLSEGTLVGTFDGVEFFITYAGGDGNDIALVTVVGGVLLGDVNLDGEVNLLDIAPFVDLIASGDFQAEADIDGNGVVDLLDVNGFVKILAG